MDSQVNAEVTATHTEEGHDVKEEKRDHIDLRHQRFHIHGEADAHLYHKQIQRNSKLTTLNNNNSDNDSESHCAL